MSTRQQRVLVQQIQKQSLIVNPVEYYLRCIIIESRLYIQGGTGGLLDENMGKMWKKHQISRKNPAKQQPGDVDILGRHVANQETT